MNELNELEIEGNAVTDRHEIEEHVKTYYNTLYNQDFRLRTDDNYYDLLDTVSHEKKESLLKEISLSDLENTLSTMSDSAPGPDGISYGFLKLVWPDYGPFLLNSWKKSLLTGQLPDSHRKSILKLIPKAGKNLKDLKNWRPITLSIVIIKL